MTASEQSGEEALHAQKTTRLVLRNVLYLIFAQIMGTPISLLINAVMARHLGPEEFGLIYLGATFVSFGFLVVDWGQGSTIPAAVARDRSRAGEVLGSGLAWKAGAIVFAYLVLALGSWLLGYSKEFQIVLALVVLGTGIGNMTATFQDVVRGFEQTKLAAFGTIGLQAATALLIIPTLLLGGKVYAVLLAQAAASLLTFTVVVRAALPVVGKLSFRRDAVKTMLREGTSFLFFGLAMVLQPYIDAVLVSKLAPPDVVGWYAASRKLVGLLIFPASALIISLYPTLCRLYGEDRPMFQRTVAGALRLVTVLVVPVAAASYLYPDIAINIFSRSSFGPAADDLRVLAVFIGLVYFTMTLGTALLAAGRQRIWAAVQLACVAVSAGLDPVLVPWFQRRYGNGGLGLCWTSNISEVLMLLAGIALAPKGMFDRALLRELVLALFAGAVLIGVAHLLGSFSPYLAGPIALIAYFVCLIVTGGLGKDELGMLRSILGKKLAR